VPEFTELDITQPMIQAGRYAANLPDGTLARIYLAMRAAEPAAQIVGQPMLVWNSGTKDWHVLGEDGTRFELVRGT